jgi:general stress protein 26
MIELDTALKFSQVERLAVLSTVTPAGEPQSALMGIAVTPDFEIVFDTVKSSRKYGNLCANPRVSLVIGCTSEITIQYEGIAQELAGDDLARYLPIYFAAFPDGPERQSWPGIVYFVVRPKWIRYCDYQARPPAITEFGF